MSLLFSLLAFTLYSCQGYNDSFYYIILHGSITPWSTADI